jgi:hypothetical protein
VLWLHMDAVGMRLGRELGPRLVLGPTCGEINAVHASIRQCPLRQPGALWLSRLGVDPQRRPPGGARWRSPDFCNAFVPERALKGMVNSLILQQNAPG